MTQAQGGPRPTAVGTSRRDPTDVGPHRADAPVIDPDARCSGASVGPGSVVGPFAHLAPGALLGADCTVRERVSVGNGAFIGHRVTLGSGCVVGEAAVVEDDVLIGPGAQVVTHLLPHQREAAATSAVVLRSGCALGAGAVVLPGIVVGRSAVVGAGAVVTKDVPPHAVVAGNPARVTGYVTDSASARRAASAAGTIASDPSRVRGVRVIDMSSASDLRGSLAFAEVGRELPFRPQRVFTVFGVPSSKLRGEHAHRECEQLLTCVSGSVAVVVDDGEHRAEIVLDDPRRALYVPAMVWATQYRFTRDAVLSVLASHAYDADDYLRDYDGFLAALDTAP